MYFCGFADFPLFLAVRFALKADPAELISAEEVTLDWEIGAKPLALKLAHMPHSLAAP